MEVPNLELPTFLRPLLLIPHYHRQLADSIKGWIDGSADRYFGPLEQIVAAVVILGLALQAPPGFWTNVPIPESRHRTLESRNHSQEAPSSARSQSILSERLSGTGQDAFDGLISFISDVRSWQINPISAALIGLGLYLCYMLIPHEPKRRMKESWNLFWPPWQDRSSTTTPSSGPSSSGSGPSRSATTALAAEKKGDVKSDSAKSARRDAVAGTHEFDDKDREKERQKRKEAEAAARAKNIQAEAQGEEEREKEKEKEKERTKRTAAEAEAKAARSGRDPDVPNNGDKVRDEEGTRQRVIRESSDSSGGGGNDVLKNVKVKEKEKEKEEERILRKSAEARQMKMKDAKTESSEHPRQFRQVSKEEQRATRKTTSESPGKQARVEDVRKSSDTSQEATLPGKEKLTHSERARRVKDGERSRDSSSLLGEVSRAEGSDEKGKQRAEGERPSDLPYLQTTAPSESILKSETRPSLEAETDTGESTTEPSGTDIVTTDSDDPLMAGDYRPLRSALKKTKKKPRQMKNIHHNHFLTMRGWRPHLVPFPHGFHPKPHEAKNSLWWDNLPKNVDHIMAPPAILKAPEKDKDEDEEGEAKKDVVTQGTGDEADEKKEVEKEKVKDEKSRPTAETKTVSGKTDSAGRSFTSDEKAKDKATTAPGDKDKAKEESKSKDTSPDKEKERAKLKAEAEAKQKAEMKAEGEAKAKQSSQANIASAPQPPPFDPQVQKAMYISQGLLCVLLYYVYEQLGLLLLAFFVWRHLHTRQQPSSSAPLAGTSAFRPSESSPSSRSRTIGSAPSPERADKSSTLEKEDETSPEMRERLEKAKAAKKADAEKPLAGDQPSSSKASSFDDLTPEQRERYERARAKKAKEEVEAGPSGNDASEVRREQVPNQAYAMDRRERDDKLNDPLNGRKPKTLDDLTPEKREQYERAMTKKRETAGKATTERPSDSRSKAAAELSTEDRAKYEAAKANRDQRQREQKQGSVKESGPSPPEMKRRLKDLSPGERQKYERARASARNEAGQRRAEGERKPKSLDDLTPEERDKYLKARAKRKQMEAAAGKPGQGSGLSAADKESLA